RSLRRSSPSTSTTESPRSTRPPCCQPPPRSSTAARGAPGHEHRRHTAQGPDMSQAPFYVSPEQLMKDRADVARKGIARGRSVVVMYFGGGILLRSENPSHSLPMIGDIYDRIGFAAVCKYNEFESLRQAGVRYADLRGYSYHRTDVTARGLTNAYAQTLAGV